ncbi:MAG: Crp/Fnr family transcriptional regulator [Salibacteraceae bacterium]
MNQRERTLLEENYGYLFEPELLNEIVESGIIKQKRQGDVIIEVGEEIRFMILLVNGSIKIMREDQEGDEMLLFFLEKGDTCTMSLSGCLGKTQSEIRAIAEQDATLLMIPVQKMAEWMKQYTGWMNFVFTSYHERLHEMLQSIDSLVFLNLHERLFKYLKDKVKLHHTTTLSVKHHEIAKDLHTSRVVISRVLKQLEKEGKIELHRNRIEVKEF